MNNVRAKYIPLYRKTKGQSDQKVYFPLYDEKELGFNEETFDKYLKQSFID